MAKYGNFMYVTEELDLVNINSRSAQLLDTLGENAGHSFNLLAANKMDAETTDRFSNGTATAQVNTILSLNDIKYSVNQLNRQSAMKFFPMATGSQNVTTSTVRQSYFGICHSDVEEDIRGMTGFVGVEQYGGYVETLMGEFGAVGGVRWASTEIGPIDAGGGATGGSGVRETASDADVYTSVIYGREAVGSVSFDTNGMFPDDVYMGSHTTDQPVPIDVINHPRGSSGVADPLNEVGSIGWKGWAAFEILNTAWFQKLESAASAL